MGLLQQIIGAVSLSLLKPPQVSMALHAGGGGGFNITALPFVDGWLRNAVCNAASAAMLHPRCLTLSFGGGGGGDGGGNKAGGGVASDSPHQHAGTAASSPARQRHGRAPLAQIQHQHCSAAAARDAGDGHDVMEAEMAAAKRAAMRQRAILRMNTDGTS